MAEPKKGSKPRGKTLERPKSLPPLEIRTDDAPLPELGAVEATLRDLIGRAEEPQREGPGKPRTLPALCLWGGLLVCVLRGFQSQAELWRLLTIRGLWQYPRIQVSDEAVRKRLMQKGGAAALEKLFEHVTKLLGARLQPYTESLASFAVDVVAIDQTTLDAVMRHLPELRKLSTRDPRLLPGRFSGRYDLRRQQWQKIEFTSDAQQNEKVAARRMVEGLARGSLILFDLGYFAFEFFDWLNDEKYHWVSRMREKASYEVVHAYYQRGETLDALVWLGQHRADRAKHLVRMVQFRHADKLQRYITNVRDPKQLRLHEVAQLYARRWDIEMAIRVVKRELKLHLLWSAHQEVILQQVWAVLILSQVFQALRKEIAGKAGVEVFDVSMALLVRMLPQFAADGLDPVEEFVRWGRFGGMIRPARRVQLKVPRINPARLRPPPEGLVTERKPRYAHRKAGSRSN